MHKFKSYISFLFLILLLFPVADKAIHEFGHLEDAHCGVSETHYCNVEHTCAICHYVFASSTTPPEKLERVIFFSEPRTEVTLLIISNTIISAKFTFQLRGPPVTS